MLPVNFCLSWNIFNSDFNHFKIQRHPLEMAVGSNVSLKHP